MKKEEEEDEEEKKEDEEEEKEEQKEEEQSEVRSVSVAAPSRNCVWWSTYTHFFHFHQYLIISDSSLKQYGHVCHGQLPYIQIFVMTAIKFVAYSVKY